MFRVAVCLCFIAIDLSMTERLYISESEYIVPEFPPGILSIIKNRKEKVNAIESNTIKESIQRSGGNEMLLPVEKLVQEADEKDYSVPDLTLNDLFSFSNNNNRKLNAKEEMTIESQNHNYPNAYVELIKSSKESIKTQFEDTHGKQIGEKKNKEKQFNEEFRTFDFDALIAQSEMEASKNFDLMDYVTKTISRKANHTDFPLNERIKPAVNISTLNMTGPTKERLFEIADKVNETYYKKMPNHNNIGNINERVKPKGENFDANFFHGFMEELPEELYKNNNVMKNLTEVVNATPEFKETPKILAPKYLRVIDKGEDVEMTVTEKSPIEGAKLVRKIIKSPIVQLRNNMRRIYRKSHDDILKSFDPKLVMQSPVNVELDTIFKTMKQPQSDEKRQSRPDDTSMKTSKAIRNSYQDPHPEDDDPELNDLIFNKIAF